MSDSKYTESERSTLRISVITAMVTTFAGSSLNIAVPDIESEFGIGATAVGWIITLYTLVTSALSVPVGKFSAKIGTKKGLTIGIGIFGMMSIAALFSVNGMMLLSCRALQGVGAAFIFATNIAILVLTFPPSKSGEALGIMTAGTYTGLSLGPVIGGFLNQHFGWRSIFVFMAVISAVAFVTAIRRFDYTSEARAKGLDQDVRGTLLYMIGIVLLIYGFSEVTTYSFGKYILLAGIAMLIVFVAVEARTEDPIVNISLFANNRIFAISNITALLNYGATFTISYLLSIYLQVVMGYSSQIAGLILIVQPVIQAMLSPRTGRLSDHVEAWKLVTAGMSICAIALFILSRLGTGSPLAVVIAMLMLAGVGVSFFSSPNTNQIMSAVGPGDKTFASAILSTMRTIGQTFSMAIVTMIAGIYVGSMSLDAAPPDLLVKTIRISFTVSTILCIAGAIMSTARKKQ